MLDKARGKTASTQKIDDSHTLFESVKSDFQISLENIRNMDLDLASAQICG